MLAAYRSSPVPQPSFSRADACYAALKVRLSDTQAESRSESDTERLLHEHGIELMRELLQAALSFKGQATPVQAVVGSDDVTRTHVRRETPRQLESIFGTVNFERESFSARGYGALQPVDAALNLPVERYSHELQRRVAQLVAECSFDKTIDIVESTTGAHVPKRQVEEIAVRAALDFDPFYQHRIVDAVSSSTFLVLSFDHKGVVMRPEDLRADAQRSEARFKPKLETRASRGEPRGRKRMAAVGAVYGIDPVVRDARDFIDALRRVDDSQPVHRPRPERKRVWASLTRDTVDLIDDAFAEAQRRDPYFEKRWFVLVDGSRELERCVRQVAARRGVSITLIVDIIHALEWLWRAVYAFHPEGSREAETWVIERLERMLQGKVTGVAAGIRRSATNRGLTGTRREVVDACVNYLHSHKHNMNYSEYLGLGAPIGTGVIEGACRHLICDRLDVTGARWRLQRAEAVLRLRALIASGDFDEYWQFHEAEERRRNHDVNYADETLPRLAQPKQPSRLRLVPTPS